MADTNIDGALSVAVADYWAGGDPTTDPIVRSILACCDATLIDDVRVADLVMFSVFGRSNGVARGVRLGVSGEPRLALGGDWSIDWRFAATPDHLRLPYWAYHALGVYPQYQAGARTPPTRFCNFLYSNATCGMRNAFFTMLDRERPVDAPGRVCNNMHSDVVGARSDVAWAIRKLDFLADYRFTIAFENEELVGYTTEKIVDAWLAGSVPIYWGNPAIEADFAPGSYVSFYDAGSLGALVRQVIELDDDPVRYAAVAAANPFRSGALQAEIDRYDREVRAFVERVVDDALGSRGTARRPLAARSAAQLRLSYGALRRRALRSLASR